MAPTAQTIMTTPPTVEIVSPPSGHLLGKNEGGEQGLTQEMNALSEALTKWGQQGWRLHSGQPITVFGGISQKATGTVLLAVFEGE